VKLEWEVKPRSQAFDGTGTQQSEAWSDSGTAGAAFNELVSSLEPGEYHWRTRILYQPSSSPFARAGRWFAPPRNGSRETDVVLGSYVGGFVWQDTDRDGVRDASEPPIAGITARLLDSFDNVLDLQLTNGDGGYRFAVRHSEQYRVRFSAPNGWQFTLSDQGPDDMLDSDANAVTGETALVLPPFESFDVGGWSAGLVQEGPCFVPDERSTSPRSGSTETT